MKNSSLPLALLAGAAAAAAYFAFSGKAKASEPPFKDALYRVSTQVGVPEIARVVEALYGGQVQAVPSALPVSLSSDQTERVAAVSAVWSLRRLWSRIVGMGRPSPTWDELLWEAFSTVAGDQMAPMANELAANTLAAAGVDPFLVPSFQRFPPSPLPLLDTARLNNLSPSVKQALAQHIETFQL